MFIKFEREGYTVFINKNHIVSIGLKLDDAYWALEFNLSDNNTQYPSYGFDFKTKEQAEKVLDTIFSKAYQDNALLVFDKESGLVE